MRRISQKFFAVLMALVMVVGMLPVSAFAETGEVIDAAIFCSDVHGSSSSVSSAFSGIKNADSTFAPSTATFVGDTQMAASSVTSAAQSVYSNVACYYAYGNHDSEGDYGISDVTGLLYGDSKTNYYIYAISQTSMASSNPDTTGFTSTVAGLDKTKPLFIASHLPLHARRGDSNGAAAWYEAISAAAEQMDIVFFWAHNHTGENDVDRAAFYVEKDGDETFTLENTSTVVTPNFTYMNAGFVGKESSRGGVVTTVKIYEDALVFQDYTSSGAFTGEYSHNVEVAREFANSTDTGTGDGDDDTDDNTGSGTTTETKEVYVLVDSLTNNGEYLIVNTNVAGSGYAMNHSSGTEGAVEVTVQTSGDYTYIDLDDSTAVWTATTKEDGFELMNGSYYLEAYGSSSAIEISTTQAYSDRYWTYSDNALGYIGGTGDHYIYYDSGFVSAKNDGSEAVYIYEKQTITVSSDGTVSGGGSTEGGDSGDDDTTGGSTETVVGNGTYTTADDGSYQKVTFGTEGEQKTVYVLVSTPTAGKNYIIASGNSAGSVYALKENTTTGTSVTVNAATGSITAPYIENSDNAIVWTASSGMNFKSVNGGYYLNYSERMGSYSLSFSTRSASDWTAGTNQLYRNSQKNDYYLRCNNGTWAMGSSNSEYNVYFYEEQTIDTSSSVTYSVSASDIEHFYTADTTDTETKNIGATTNATGGSFTYEILSDEKGIISGDIASDGTITFSGNEGTAQVKVSYTWAAETDVNEDGVVDANDTYTIWQVIDVKATSPYYTLDITKGDKVVTGTTITEKGVTSTTTLQLGSQFTYTTADGTETLTELPEGATLEWNIPEEYQNIATIDENGLVTFKGVDGAFYVTVTLTVNGKDYIAGVNISATTSQYSVPTDGTEDFPEYPNEGAIRFDKTATAVGNFSETGIAQIELSMTGVPYTTGSEIDVVIMLDMTGSMTTASMNAAEAAALAFARQIILNEDESYNNNRISVQVFSKDGVTELWSLSAVTEDTYSALTTAIAGASDNRVEGGTPYSTALQACYETLYAAKSDGIGNNRQQFCVFVSDGTPTSVTYITNTTTPSTTTTVSFTRNNATYTQTVPAYSTDTSTSTFESSSNSYHEYWSQLMINNDVAVYGVYTSAAAGSGDVNDTTTGGLVMGKVASDSSKVYTVSDYTDTSALTGVFTNIAQDILQAATDITVEDKITDEYTMIFDLPTGDKTITGLDSQEFYIEFVKYTLDDDHERVDSDSDGDTYDDATSVTKLYLIDSNGDNAGGTYSAGSSATTAYDAPVFEQKVIGEKGTMYYWSTNASDGDADISVTVDGTTYYFVSYGMEEAGYNMTSGAYAYGTIDEVTNTSTDLVIATPYFVYNADTKMLYWTVDKLDTTEYALRYFLYLDNSATEVGTSNEAPAATYPTNDHAYITYTNFRGNDCRQEFPIPRLTWNGAQVSYVFYLVNSAGQPINKSGQVVDFANAVFITDVYTKSVVWNKDGDTTTGTGELSADWLADELLPDEYTIYDELAGFTLNVYEKADGTTIKNQFTIEGDTAANISTSLNNRLNLETTESTVSTVTTKVYNTKAGTKITGYGTYDSATLTSIDFSNTTVAFAVVWESKLVEDVVVVDFGLDVLINVVANDLLQNTVSGIGVGNSAYGNIEMNTGVIATSQLGAAALTIDGNTISIENENAVRFHQGDMEFAEPVKFYYESPAKFYEDSEQKTGYMYSSVTVIPATTIYYEDEFLTLESYTVTTDENGTSTSAKDTTSKWTTAGTASNATQAQDRPGASQISADLDADNVYGYDAAYKDMSTYSMGSAAKISVDAATRGEATFTFYGTGFDVISMTSNMTGTIIVQVYSGASATGTAAKSSVVDTYYGYTQNEDGEWVTSVNDPNALYQVPVMKMSGLTYGQYTVKIVAGYNDYFNHTATEGGYDLYLDAIRIYDPAGVAGGSVTNTTIQDAYKADKEAWPQYIELRNNIIAASNYTVTENEDGTVTISGTNLSGAIFIDSSDATTSITDYVSYGPNNELYLKKGQSVAFALDQTYASIIADVQVAVKLGNGSSAAYEIYNAAIDGTKSNVKTGTLTAATDLYYSIKDLASGTIVISNTGDGILSITNIKVTYTQNPYGTASSSGENLDDGIMTTSLYADEEVATAAVMSLRSAPVVDEPETPEEPETPVKPDEPDEPVTPDEPETPVEPDEPEAPEEPEIPDAEQVVTTILKKVINTIKSLLGWLFK